jgi:5-methylcytosine-specific restriction endonuclease McrA
MNSLAQLPDASLHSELKRLVGCSNTLSAQLLAHLGEVEGRGIHRERACSSLYTYCVYELRMSEDEAQRRCRAARLARRFPILLDMLAEASLHLTGILLIGPHLTEENQGELLARARFRTKREIERLVAEVAPCPDVPSRIVPLHRAGAVDSFVAPLEDAKPGLLARPRNSHAAYVRSLAGAVREMEAGLAAGQAPPRASDEAAADGAIRDEVVPEASDETAADGTIRDAVTVAGHDANTPVPSGVSEPAASVPPPAELRYKVQFTADQAYVDLLEEARNLLQHELPARDLVEVQRRALELLVRKLRQRKYAASERPRRKAPEPRHEAPSAPRLGHTAPKSGTPDRHAAPKSAQQSRYVPAEVRRSVWQRDEARCTYLDARGQRCREQSGLQFHHQHPHARGGPASVENLTLRCHSHNALAAEQDFGRDVVRQKRSVDRAEPPRAGAAH